VNGRRFVRRNHFTEGPERPAKRGFDRLAGQSDDDALYLNLTPWVIVTDKPRSYGVAKRQLLPEAEHRQSR
jgi:hypothetical protein